MYTTLRSNGLFTLENMLSYFERVWEVIPPKMYNESQQIKYINDGAVGMVALHGNRKLQIKKWLRERIAYLDSKFGYYAGGGTNEQYVNFRMNYQGAVSLDISTYYTVYAKVRWASKNEQVIRIAKGQKKTFSYYSDVGTDREVMIMLPESLKTIENISNIHPNSIDISKATKLTQIEAHNPNLFSVDLSKNKYLRKVDFNGCEKLGTETATMTLNYCKYLNKVDLRGTKITAVTFNTKGGSLREIYYPTTIQSINLINQGLLTDMILPYGEDGNKAPVDLATINIENCPNISKLIDLTSNPTSLDGMKYCRNMTINNSIKLSTINFNGFTRLANVNLQNIETLEAVDFLNLTKKGETSSLRYIGVSACPKLTTISMNVNDPNYEITWANEGILDLQTSGAVRTIESNCVIKGLTTIILPQTIESLYFTTEYGSGYADVMNIWSAEATSVSKTGVFPVAYHLNSENITDEYVGIDFRGLSLKNIDLGGLVNIPDAINFSLYPTHVNPNFNLHRDGVSLPYLQPKGTLDLTNYTGSLAKFFNGVDLDVLAVTSNKILPQTDYSYCFYNSIFTTLNSINPLLGKIDTIKNASHMFDSTIISDAQLLDTLTYSNGAIIDYMFTNTQISNLDNVMLPSSIGSAQGTFSSCRQLTSAQNMNIAVNGSIAHLLENCTKLSNITGTIIKNATSIAYLLSNVGRINPIPLVSTWNLSNCSSMEYAFNGCDVSGVIDFTGLTIGNSNCLYNYIFNGASNLNINLTDAKVNGGNIGGFGKGVNNYTINLTNVDLSATTDFTSAFEGQSLTAYDITNIKWSSGDLIFDKMFKGTKITTDFLLPLNVVSCQECFASILTMQYSHSNWLQTYNSDITPNNCYLGNTNIKYVDDEYKITQYTEPMDEIPTIWGGYGFNAKYTTICEFTIEESNLTLQLSNNAAISLYENGIVNWGDGTVTYGEVSHTYAKAGVYAVKGKYWFNNQNLTWASYVSKIVKMLQVPVSGFWCFCGAKYLTYADLSNAVLTNVNAMFNMVHCRGSVLEKIIFNNTRIQNSSLASMVSNNSAITSLDITGIVFEAGISNLSNAFGNNPNLTEIIGIENLNVSACSDFSGCFNGDSSLMDFSFMENWDISSGTNFNYMFRGCQFESITLPSLIRGNSFAGMFQNCPNLLSLENTVFEQITVNTSNGGSMADMFAGCPKLTNIGGLIVRGSVRSTFYNCTNLVRIGEFRWGADGVATDTYLLFKNMNTGTVSINFTGISPPGFTGGVNNGTWNIPDFDHDSLLSLFNSLNPNGVGSEAIGSTNNPLKLKAKSLARMSDAEIAIATAKGWTIA